MTLCASALFRHLTAITTVGLCVRPEKVGSLKTIISAASAAPCRLEVFETLSVESTLGDAKSLFLSGCEEKYTSDQCNFAAEDLWFGHDLASTSGLEMDSDLCESLRHAVSASERAGLTQNTEKAVSMEASISSKLRRSRGSSNKNMMEIQQVRQQSNEEDKHGAFEEQGGSDAAWENVSSLVAFQGQGESDAASSRRRFWTGRRRRSEPRRRERRRVDCTLPRRRRRRLGSCVGHGPFPDTTGTTAR